MSSSKEPELLNVVAPSGLIRLSAPSAPAFDWKNEKLQEFVERASQMQDKRVSDNNMTKCFAYKRSEVDMLELRICMVLYGFKMRPTEDMKSGRMAIGSLLKNYSWAERHRARELKNKIVKDSKDSKSDTVKVNVIYVSAAFPDKKTDFNVSEYPVFILNESGKFMDDGGRVYKNWDDYLDENCFQTGVMVFPENGSYTPEDENKNPVEKVKLVARETPACRPSAVAKSYVDAAVAVTGVALTVVTLGTAAVTALPLMTYTVATLSAISTGSAWLGTACTAYTVIMGGYDKLKHDQSVATEMMMLATAICTSLTARFQASWSKKLAEQAKDGALWENIVKGISRTERWLYTTINLLKIASTASAVMSALYNMWMKENRTWMDYAQLCIALYFFTNTVTKPITLQGVFETEQGHLLRNHFRHKVHSKEAIEEYEKTMASAKTSKKKSYIVRNLREIRDLDDYFSRVHRYSAHVQYTKDGLVIDGQLKISPRAYNQIGDEYLTMQLNDISKNVTIKRCEDLVDKLIQDFGGDELKEKFPGIEDEFKRFVRGEVSEEENAALMTTIKQVAKHRKDQLFGDLARFRGTGSSRARERYLAMENYVWNERFMFTVHEENLHWDLKQLFGVSDYRNITVNGVRIFENMSINDVDRMSRMLNDLGSNREAIVQIARRLAEDPNFTMNSNNPAEFADVLEAVRQSGSNLQLTGQFEQVLNNPENEANMLKEINNMVQEVRNAQLVNGEMEFASEGSAAVHAAKHKCELGPKTTTEQYLNSVAGVLTDENATGVVFTQDGRAIRVNYGLTDREGGRYRFGVTRTDLETRKTNVLTTFSRKGRPGSTVAPNNLNRLPIRKPKIVYHEDVDGPAHDISWFRGPNDDDNSNGAGAPANNPGSGGNPASGHTGSSNQNAQPENTGNQGQQEGTGLPEANREKNIWNKFFEDLLRKLPYLPLNPKPGVIPVLLPPLPEHLEL